jgi:hypothetical protein
VRFAAGAERYTGNSGFAVFALENLQAKARFLALERRAGKFYLDNPVKGK